MSGRQTGRCVGEATLCRAFRGRRGMTLTELLVVVAILSILFGLLILPLMRAFGFIRTSNVRVAVQNVGRTVFESLVRELSDAVHIYDNLDDPTLSTLIFVLPHGVGANAGQRDPGDTALPPTNVPILITPGPGLDFDVSTPLHVAYCLALSQPAVNGVVQPYFNRWEMENPDLSAAGLDPTAPLVDNLYRLTRVEFYPTTDPAAPVQADPRAMRFVLSQVLPPNLYPGPWAFREPGFLDDSLLQRKRADIVIRDSPESAERLTRLLANGQAVGLTPRREMDVALAVYSPPSQNAPAAWAVRPGLRFEPKHVQNETLDPVRTGSASYATAYRADFGHWQVVRRKEWAHPYFSTPLQLPIWARFFQTFEVQVSQRYSNQWREYYVSQGRIDSNPQTEPGDPADPRSTYYYVFRRTDPRMPEPVDGTWPATDTPVFNIARYLERIDRFRQGPAPGEDPNTFWTNNNPYQTELLPSNVNEPYWPEMAFLVDPTRGTVDFRVDAPVRPPQAGEPQPPGPLAPFQVPYDGPRGEPAIPPPDGNTADWIIPDVPLALASTRFSNGDGTTWIRIPAETIRVMVSTDGGATWRAYTRVSQRTLLGPGEFCFDERTGHLAFDPDEAGNWNASTKIRAWYQLQTNVQRATPTDSLESTGGHGVTASYFTKELFRVTLAIRAYDSTTGRAQPFQLSATVRPRNLR